MAIIITVSILALYAVTLMLIMASKKGLQVAYADGRRAGLKAAVEAAKERGDVAVLVAPEGEMTMAMVRAQTAHQIEMDLRDLLARA